MKEEDEDDDFDFNGAPPSEEGPSGSEGSQESAPKNAGKQNRKSSKKEGKAKEAAGKKRKARDHSSISSEKSQETEPSTTPRKSKQKSKPKGKPRKVGGRKGMKKEGKAKAAGWKKCSSCKKHKDAAEDYHADQSKCKECVAGPRAFTRADGGPRCWSQDAKPCEDRSSDSRESSQGVAQGTQQVRVLEQEGQIQHLGFRGIPSASGR